MFLSYQSSNKLYVLGMTNALTGAEIINATVTATVYNVVSDTDDTLGSAVSGASGLTLTYQAGSLTIPAIRSGSLKVNQIISASGNYIGEIPNTAALVENTHYWVVETIVASGKTLTIKRKVECRDFEG